jgi:hypothetical protein
MTRYASRTLCALLAIAGASACFSVEPLPEDCGDATMAIVTFQGKTKEDEAIRTCVDIHVASRRDATRTSAGRDESFAVSQPNVIPWTNLTLEEAVNACGRAGKFLCEVTAAQIIGPAPSPSNVAGEEWSYDPATIARLKPTGAETSVAHRFDAVLPLDALVNAGRPRYPDTSGSVAVWASSPPAFDKSKDPSIPLVVGRIRGTTVQSGYLPSTPIPDATYKHPLLGFRCCVNAKMRSAFTPIAPNEKYLRAQEDNVPIEGR